MFHEISSSVRRNTSAKFPEPTHAKYNPQPAAAEAPKHITLASGETEKQAPAAPKPQPSANPDERRKYVHHQCHEITTYDDQTASHLRDSPFYIKEL